MFDVFISHSSLDKEKFVQPLVEELQKFNLRVWYDKYSINKGDIIKDSIIYGINSSIFFVTVLTQNYFQSNWSNVELGVVQATPFNNFLPIVFEESKNLVAQKYPFILGYNYIDGNTSIQDIAEKIKNIVNKKKQECGLLHIEKTDLKFLIEEMRSYNNFKLEKLAIDIGRIERHLKNDLVLQALKEINLILHTILSDVMTLENIIVYPDTSVVDNILDANFLSQNLQEHIKFLSNKNEELKNFTNITKLEQEELYLIQFSLYSILEWYITIYFKKPILKSKKLNIITPEEFSNNDIVEVYKIENLVLPPKVIASIDTDIKWFQHNPLTMIGVRDTETGKLVGFFSTLPIDDSLYDEIYSGNFDDTKFDTKNICQYNMPGPYNLYLCSFCIHPAYNATNAFITIYRAFIDLLISLVSERGIYISRIIADAVTSDGVMLCERAGMQKVTTSTHNSSVYVATLIPPDDITLKSNKNIKKLIAYYQKIDKYQGLF